MIKKRTYIIMILIILIFFVVMFLVFGLQSLKQEKESTTIVVGNDIIWQYKNKKWQTIREYSEIEKLNWQKYNIFVNNESLGENYLWHDDKWYAFDDNKKAVNLDGDLLGIKSSYDIKVYQTNIEKTEENIVEQILDENNIQEKSFTSNYKVALDLDEDGITEEFYVLSNTFPMDFNPKQIFSLVYMLKNNELYPIYQDISDNNSYNGCKPYFTSFLDINDDSSKEFILSCSEYSISNPKHTLYEFKDNEFKTIISNQ